MLTRHHSLAGQHGQVIPLVAIVFVFALGMIIVAVADALALEDQFTRADTAAFAAAQAGANAITVETGGPIPKVTLAPDAAALCAKAAAVTDPGSTPACTVTPEQVTATVVQHVRLPVALFGITPTVSATHRASPVIGTTRARSAPASNSPH